MFERFTDQARQVVVLAQQEARNLNHHYIGTEHFLLGLLREGRGAGAKALQAAGTSSEAAQREVERLAGRGGPLPPAGHIPFTPQAKKVLELSLREALHRGDNYVGTGHLLLGLAGVADDVGVQVLGRLGVNLDDLRERVSQEMREHPEEDPAEPARTAVPGPAEALAGLLEEIDGRLTAIEQRLGIPAPAQEKPRRPDEVLRLRAEVARLTALLREHHIDPGEPGDARPGDARPGDAGPAAG